MNKIFMTSINLLLFAVLLLGGTVAFAQTNDEINAGIQFNLSTPGARSLALGGAFVALADDATAAFTNPAGLTILSKPEISIEGRKWSFTTEFTDAGHAYGPATQIGIDTVEGIRPGASEQDTTGLSFISFVYPGKKWALAIYRHELANFEAGYRTQGAFLDLVDPSDPSEPFRSRYFPVIADMELNIENFGISSAFAFGRLSLGIGLSFYQLDIASRTQRFWLGGFGTDPGETYGPPDYSEANLINLQTQEGDDDDVGFNVGLLWSIGRKWSFGAVYRQGPEFEFDARHFWWDDLDTPLAQQVAPFNVPDVLAFGIAFRPTTAMTITLDYDKVEYSALTENTVNIFNENTTPEFAAVLARLTTDDADEFHLGLEYVFGNLKAPLALRVGSWYDPDHKIYYDGDPGTDEDARSEAALFRSGDDVIHYTAGIGFAFHKFQLDAAVDFSDLVDTASLSAVFRF